MPQGYPIIIWSNEGTEHKDLLQIKRLHLRHLPAEFNFTARCAEVESKGPIAKEMETHNVPRNDSTAIILTHLHNSLSVAAQKEAPGRHALLGHINNHQNHIKEGVMDMR